MPELRHITRTDIVLGRVNDERLRQQKLLSEGHVRFDCASPYTSDGDRLAVLMEEVGEVARAMMEDTSSIYGKTHNAIVRQHLVEELVQVAAVAVACAEGVLAEMNRP